MPGCNCLPPGIQFLVNFWFNEKHKKSQFCVTLSKWSILRLILFIYLFIIIIFFFYNFEELHYYIPMLILEICDDLCDVKGGFQSFLYHHVILKVWTPGTDMSHKNELLYIKYWVTYKLKKWLESVNIWMKLMNVWVEFSYSCIWEQENCYCIKMYRETSISGPPIKQTPSIKQTLSLVLKLASLWQLPS